MANHTTKAQFRKEYGRINCAAHPLHGQAFPVLDKRHFRVERPDGSSMFAGLWYVLQRGTETLWLPCRNVELEGVGC